MAERGQFYVYRIFMDAVTVYVGKGCGRRLKNQMCRFKLDGEVIEWCKSETAAFKAERRWIATLKPTENKNLGGSGGRARRMRRCKDRAAREMERIGTRVYAARALLRLDLRGQVTANQMARIKEIANLSTAC